MERKCIIISDVVRKRTLPLEEALSFYNVDKQTYLEYTAKALFRSLNADIIDLIGVEQLEGIWDGLKTELIKQSFQVLLPQVSHREISLLQGKSSFIIWPGTFEGDFINLLKELLDKYIKERNDNEYRSS